MNKLMIKDRDVKKRKSNIELFRIILMILIIAHHYVVNSGMINMFDSSDITCNMIFLQMVGFWGKIGIDCFLLISGYFMCSSNIRGIKWIKLLFQIMFYNVIICIFLLATGNAQFSIKYILKSFIPLIWGYGTGEDSFISLFMLLFLLIPFINKLIESMNKKQHLILLGILLLYFSILSTFLNRDIWEGIGWYTTVYLLGSFIRKYVGKKIDNLKVGILLTIISVLLIILSILFVDFIGVKFGFNNYYFMVYPASKLFVIQCAVSCFLLFKNLKIKYNIIINTIASATFGVLLIHANSMEMINFVWHVVFRNTDFYKANFITLLVHTCVTIFTLYICCVLIDLLRINLLEKPFFIKIENIVKKRNRLIN